jgi:16S rRNA (adenine1518-N6/adenine1519-N6)-dimethyltransferase
MQKLGQHFLKNAAVLDAIVNALEIQNGETIIEIGPGHGELTIPLVRAAGICDGTIISVEKDHSLIGPLVALAKKERPGLLTIIEGDALRLLPEITAERRGYKVVGNIPYYITGKLLRTIGELENKPERTELLIQKEVAERICAAPPEMNRLAASVQFWADPKIVALVPRKDFFPAPEVDSAVITLDTKDFIKEVRPAVDPAQYYRAMRAIFAQPRKTVLNNLSSMAGASATKSGIITQLQKIGIDPGARPQDLSISQIIAITNAPLWG